MVRCAVSLHHVVLFEKHCGQFVASQLHAFEFFVLPAVHFERPHEGDVDAEVAMDRGALVAEENADVGRGPFRVLAFTVETHFVLLLEEQPVQHGIALVVWNIG